MKTEPLQVKRSGDFYYPIYFEEGFGSLADAIRTEGLDSRKMCIVSDTNVAPLYADSLKSALSSVASSISLFVFEAGEKSKHLGGGVVGDLAGFSAATYLRGIDFIQVPTTLLAQVDSSVGGKTGVDFNQYKNMVGAFHQPRLVYMNLQTLKSLPDTQFACGMGEVLKTGLICDGDFYHFVCEHQSRRRRT